MRGAVSNVSSVGAKEVDKAEVEGLSVRADKLTSGFLFSFAALIGSVVKDSSSGFSPRIVRRVKNNRENEGKRKLTHGRVASRKSARRTS